MLLTSKDWQNKGLKMLSNNKWALTKLEDLHKDNIKSQSLNSSRLWHNREMPVLLHTTRQGLRLNKSNKDTSAESQRRILDLISMKITSK